MATLREQILAAVKTLLSGATPAGTNVYRSRAEPFTRDELPAIVIEPKTEDVTSLAQEISERLLGLEVIIHVRGDVSDTVSDTIAQPAHAVIMADQTLGGLCARVIEKSSNWEFADADSTANKLTLTYDVKYHTKSKDLAAR